jgi:hypothetical protein
MIQPTARPSRLLAFGVGGASTLVQIELSGNVERIQCQEFPCTRSSEQRF